MKKNYLVIIFIIISINLYAQNVGINTLTPQGKLHIKGSADTSQLVIDANSTQSNLRPLIRLRKSDGTDLLWMHSDDSTNVFLGLKAGRINNATGAPLGLDNTFLGSRAGYSNTSGYENTASGSRALYFNTTGHGNIAIGNSALYSNISGHFNTAIGQGALGTNSALSYGTAIGFATLGNNSTGRENTAIGALALSQNSTASENTAIGFKALENQSFSNNNTQYVSGNTAIGYFALNANQPTVTTNGMYNTAIGHFALRINITGFNNTAIGKDALYSNSTGFHNTANGYKALFSNSLGFNNSASGADALHFNTLGNDNTATGLQALYYNSVGSYNTAIGRSALNLNTTASENTAIGNWALFSQSFSNGGALWNSNNVAVGYQALYNNQPTSQGTGINNTAVGHSAMQQNGNGDNNTAMGYRSLYFNTSGYFNTAIGNYALETNNGYYNTAIGYNALSDNTGGFRNIAVGHNSGIHPATPNIYNTVSIGNDGSFLNAYQNQVIIGNSTTGFIGGKVDWGLVSDARIKNTVTEDVKGLDFISRLRPVTYFISSKAITTIAGTKETPDFPGKYDGDKIKYTGFIAQEVEQAAIDAGFDFSGYTAPKNEWSLYTIRYATFVVPLVKAVQEQQSIIETLQKQVVAAKAEIPIQIGKQQLIIEEQNKKIDFLLKEMEILKQKLK